MMDYMEWVELQEVRESSNRAMKKATKSIWIAGGALVVNVVFALITLLNVDTVRLESSQIAEQATS